MHSKMRLITFQQGKCFLIYESNAFDPLLNVDTALFRWEVIGMQFVSSIATTLTSTMGMGMLSSMGDTGSALQVLNIFSAAASQGRDVQATSTAAPSNPLQVPNTHDPAFVYIPIVLESVRSLGAMLTAKDDGVDWDNILTTEEKNGFRFVQSNFQKAKGLFAASDQPPSKKLSDVLDIANKVCIFLHKIFWSGVLMISR